MSSVRILLVEDDISIQRNLQTLLQIEGYETRAAGDGEAALRSIERWRPDLVLLDLILTPGMDGEDFFRALRDRPDCRRLPVILVSAAYHCERIAERLGCPWVQKPFRMAQLCQAIADSLRAGMSE